MTEQLELFERTKEEKLEAELASAKKSIDNLRKGLFHRHTTLSKEVTYLQDKVEELQMQIIVLDRFLKEKP